MDELQKYYEYLRKAKADVPDTYESFRNTMQDSASSRKYYEYLRANKFDTPDSYDSFINTFDLKKKEPSKAASLFGGIAGTSVPLSEEDKIAQALKTVGTSKDQSPLPQEPKPEIDRNDPVKSIYAPVRNKLAELRQRPVAESVGQDPLLKKRQSGEVSAALMQKSKLDATPVFDNTNQAVGFIQERLDPSKLVSTKPIDMMQKPTLDDFTEESIVAAMPKGNETVELGVKKYLDNRKVKESIYSSNNLGEAAVKLAALKGDLTSKQIQQLGGNIPKSMQGNLLIGLLNDENTKELAENDAQLNSKIMETVYNLPDTHPQAAARYLIQTLSQERENRGLNNAVLNFTSVGTNDDIVDDLVAKGKLSAQYKNMYDNPAVKFYVNSKLKTPGFVENVVSGLEGGLTGFGKTAQETGILGSTIDNSQKQLYDALDKDYQQVALKPKSLLHDITMTGGNIVGQIIPIAAGGNYLQAAKIVTNPALANSISIGLQTYGDYKEQARKDMPDAGEMKQTAYALLNTGIEMSTENIVNDTKLVKQAVSKYSPEIQDVIKKFTAKEISREAAKSQVNDIFSRVLEQAKTFGSKTGKIMTGEANEELAANVLQNANNQIFGGEEKSVPQMADEAFEVWKTTLFGGIPLGAIGGISSLKNNKPATELIYDVAGSPEKYIPLVQEQAAVNDEYAIQAADIVDNIEYASKVRAALDKSTDLTESQKKRFLIASINANNLQKEAAKIPDPVLRKPIEKEIQKATEEKEKALTEVEIDQDRDLMDEETDESEFMSRPKEEILVDVPTAASAIQDENIKQNIIANPEQGLAEIAQQLHSTEGEASTATKVFGRDLSDLALEMYPTREAADEALQKQSAVSVQMPGEVSKPQTTEIKPAETQSSEVLNNLSKSDRETGTIALFESGLSIEEGEQLVEEIKNGNVTVNNLHTRLNVPINTLFFAKKLLTEGKLADALGKAIEIKKSQKETVIDIEEQNKKSITINEKFINELKQKRDSEDFKYIIVEESDVLGNRKKVKRLKTKQELEESTKKINDAINKAEKENEKLKLQLKEQPKPAEPIEEDMTAFVKVTRPELGFEELPTDILDNMDSKTMAVQGKRLEGLNKNLEKLKELFECIWS